MSLSIHIRHQPLANEYDAVGGAEGAPFSIASKTIARQTEFIAGNIRVMNLVKDRVADGQICSGKNSDGDEQHQVGYASLWLHGLNRLSGCLCAYKK